MISFIVLMLMHIMYLLYRWSEKMGQQRYFKKGLIYMVIGFIAFGGIILMCIDAFMWMLCVYNNYY